MTVQDILKKVA